MQLVKEYLCTVNQLSFCQTVQHCFVLSQILFRQMLTANRKSQPITTNNDDQLLQQQLPILNLSQNTLSSLFQLKYRFIIPLSTTRYFHISYISLSLTCRDEVLKDTLHNLKDKNMASASTRSGLGIGHDALSLTVWPPFN